MGPFSRYLGAEVPAEPRLWMDPVPAVDHPLIGEADVAALKAQLLAALPIPGWWPRPGPRPAPSATATSAAAPMARASGWPRKRTGR
jgi:hypothetical protein